MDQSPFRQLPSVDKLLSDEIIKKIGETLPHEVVVELIRHNLAEIREAISSGEAIPPFEKIVDSLVSSARELDEPSLRRVINATGVILHTNLGRAPLSAETIEAMKIAAQGYSNLEFDLDSGERGSRDSHLNKLLCQITGAQASLVVNNNASAVLLALTALARKKEVIVSRGQAVQIGGGFRIPDVLQQSGARLVEVGTTNFTSLPDYEQAITPRTAALLRVHSSNFKITGFTQSVSLKELAALGKSHNLPVLDDVGSGCLFDTGKFGLEPEPMVQDSVSDGAALVFFSGDKLLGGPQAGIIVGKTEYIEKLRKHPLVRAMRIDKVRLAGLAATLLHYLKGEAVQKIPVLRLIATPLPELEKRAGQWARLLSGTATTAPGETMVGGGSLPGSSLPTRLVVIKFRGEVKVQDIAQMLRQHKPPIITRVARNSLILDPRSVFPEEDEVVVKALQELVLSQGTL